jgi:hypothetical protein
MKKIRKILLFSLLGLVVLGIVLGFAFGGADSISNFLGKAYYGYVEFEWDQDLATRILVYTIFAVIFFVIAVIFAVNVRRKKSKAFPIYAFFTTMYALFGIFSAENGFDFVKDAGGLKGTVAVTLGILPGVLLLALTVLSMPTAFEHSELHSNSKESDAWKLTDLIFGATLAVLYIPVLLIISGAKFNVFGSLFGTLTVVLVVIQIFVYGFFGWRLAKQKKPVAAALLPLAIFLVELVAYTYYHYGWIIRYNTWHYLLEGSVIDQLEALLVVVYFFTTIAYGMYIGTQYVLTIFEERRQKLYNHREKYVYGDRRKFGDSVVKEWEASKAAQAGFGSSFADIAAAIEAQKAADLAEVQRATGLQGVILDENDITNDRDTQNELKLEQAAEDESEIAQVEAREDDADDSRKGMKQIKLVGGEEPKEFRLKLMTLEPKKRERYNKVRNRLESYKKIKQKFSNTVDSYRYAGELVAKMSIIGTTLRLHLALDPDSYDVNKYHQIDLSAKQKYIFVPFTLKLKGPTSVELALQLIDELMKGFDIPQQKGYKDKNFAQEVAEELKAAGLIEEIDETPAEAEESKSVSKKKKAKAEAPAEETPAEEATAEEAPVAEEAAPAEEASEEAAPAQDAEESKDAE